jgi:predicted TIM-barrel fold metal-dependent hydrolase
MRTHHDAVEAVDTHAHVFTRDLPLSAARRYAPGYDAPPDAYLAMLERNGMSHGVLVQPSFLGVDNAYLIAAIGMAPGRLRGIAVVEPDTPLADLRHLKDAGVVGIRLNLIGQDDPDFAAAVWQRHLGHLAALDWQIEVQAEAHRLPALLRALLPIGVPIVVDHFGRPDPTLGFADPGFRHLLDTAHVGRIWVKLSGAYRNFRGPDAERLATEAAGLLRQAFGPQRLVWGSDWPHTQFESQVDPQATRRALDTWLPDPADRRIVLGETPARLFGFRAGASHGAES